MDLRLRPLRTADETQARAAHAELLPEGFSFLLGNVRGESWGDYLSRLARYRTPEGTPRGLVPATLLVAEVEGDIVGRASIRHELDDMLLRIGGHIGYGVRPQHRRRGYATEIPASP